MKNNFKTSLFLLFLLSTASQAKEHFVSGLAIRKLSTGSGVALAPCPTSPNCVTSYHHENMSKENVLKPFQSHGDALLNRERLIKALLLDKAEIITNSDSYIHATYTSRIWKFVDDVEFYLPNDSYIHFRSASRSGYFDFGVNRKRIEMLRFRYDQRE